MKENRCRSGPKKILHDVDPLAETRSVSSWLNSLREGPGRRSCLYNLARYMRWRQVQDLESNPDCIIEECLNGTNRTLAEHLRQLKEYCKGEMFEGSKPATRLKHYNTVRSFYEENEVSLPKSKFRLSDASEGEVKVKVDVTATDFLDMARRAVRTGISVRNRSILLTQVQCGTDANTLATVFNFVAYPQLVKHFGTEEPSKWDVSKCPVRIDLVRPKTTYRYFTFIDVDAVEALKDWLAERKRITGQAVRIYSRIDQSYLPRSDPIYLADGEPIKPYMVNLVFRRTGFKAGVNVKLDSKPEMFKGARVRYPFHSHEVRDTIVTLARRVQVDPAIANFLIGHSIDRYKYDKSPWDYPEHYRQGYLKIARPYLNLVSQAQIVQNESRDKEEIAQIKRELEEVKAHLMRLVAPTASLDNRLSR